MFLVNISQQLFKFWCGILLPVQYLKYEKNYLMQESVQNFRSCMLPFFSLFLSAVRFWLVRNFSIEQRVNHLFENMTRYIRNLAIWIFKKVRLLLVKLGHINNIHNS